MNSVSASDVRGKLKAILPLVLVAALLAGLVLFGVLLVLPEWQSHTDLVAQVDADETALDEARQSREEASSMLQIQIERSQSRLDEAATMLLSASEADMILNRVYGYASSIGVEIIDLQLQPPAEPPSSLVYEVRRFKIQVAGLFPQLLGFVSLFQESALPGVSLENVTIAAGETRAILGMDMLLYTSSYAPGDVLASLPKRTPPPPMATPMPTPTVLPPTPTATLAPTATPAVIAPTPAGAVVGLGVYDDAADAVRYITGRWETISSVQGYGGSYHYSEDLTAEAQFAFIGTDVVVQYVAFRNFGVFEVYIDGKLWGEVDAYAASGTFGRLTHVTGLTYSTHVLSLKNTSRRNPASTGNVIAIDAIHVLQPTTDGS